MVLSLDLGSGSAKARPLALDGTTIAEFSVTYAVKSPHPTWAESDPNDWWRAI